MPKKIIGKFKVEYVQILDEKGKIDSKLMPKISAELTKQLYETMTLVRAFDAKAIAMQRQGRISTYASVYGQEAAQVASAMALEDADWLFPSYRESAALIARKTPMELLLLYFGGDERGSRFPEGVNNFPIAIPVSTQIPHATGVGLAMKIKGHKAAALVYFGDGASSRGDFHEALNMAGVFQTNSIFFCQNNQYAISLPRVKQTHADTIAQKAIAYGMEGIQIDGNDPFAVYNTVNNALKKAKEGKGPTLIEAFTYRLGDHTTSDDAKKYRDPKEAENWKKRDPLLRLRLYMKLKMMWDEDYEKKLMERVQKKVEDAVARFESTKQQSPDDMFNYHFSEMPKALAEQRDLFLQELKQREKEGKLL